MLIIREFKTKSIIKGYHTYTNVWTPVLGETLSARQEPENEMNKYAVAATKDARVVGHLKKWKTGRYAQTVFYFLQANPLNTANITVTGKRLYFGDGQGLYIPCTILVLYTEILKAYSKVWDNFWHLKALLKRWKMLFVSP